MDGQLSIFDIRDEAVKPSPSAYRFRRYIGQKVKFNHYCGDDDSEEHIVTGIEKYYTLLDDGRWVGTPTTIYPVEKGDYDTWDG